MDSSARIAIVEGPTFLREGLIASFTRLGHHVAIIADHGDHYIKASRECAVDLVVVNVGPYHGTRAPGMEGVATLGWIHRHTPRVHTLALSEWPDAVLAYRAFRAGACAFEHRNGNPALLPRIVKAVLAGDYYGNAWFQGYLDGLGKAPPEKRLTSTERLGLFTEKGKVIFEYLLRYPHIDRTCMAGRLNMKPDTLKSQLSKLYATCGVPDKAGLIHWAARHGHLPAEDSAHGR